MAEKWKYDDYRESQTVQDAYNQYKAQQSNAPDAYTSAWQGQLNDMLSKIQNREKFTYDVNRDALYQQYKNQYMQNGKLAMQDAMGQAAALTGGYGNSYAATVGNQAYQQYLTGLTDKIPELASLAYDRYKQEGQDLLTQYGLLQDRESTDYSRYRDKVSDYNTMLDRLYNIYNNERSFDYGRYGDNRTLSYTQYRDAVADEQSAARLAEEQRQFNESMAWQKQQAAAAKSAAATADVDFHALSNDEKNSIIDNARKIAVTNDAATARKKLQEYLTTQINDSKMTDSQALTIYKQLTGGSGEVSAKTIQSLKKMFLS